MIAIRAFNSLDICPAIRNSTEENNGNKKQFQPLFNISRTIWLCLYSVFIVFQDRIAFGWNCKPPSMLSIASDRTMGKPVK